MNARPSPPDLPLWTYAGAPRFRARALLGQGRLGLVYHAHDEHTGQDVALKTLPVLEPEPLYHLKEEFRALAGMAHPNLVELYELVVEGSQCFFTMELLRGRPFTEHPWAGAHWAPGRGPIPPPALAALCAALEQLALGITALHREGRLHRDIKPSNVLVTDGARVVLLDFDLALRFHPGDPREPDDFAGTPEYMAPEQIWSRPLTPAADWYSLGVLLYEALSGQLPFTGPLHDLLHDKQHSAARPLRDLVPGLPPDLDALVAALLHPEPARRPDAAAILHIARRLARLPTAPPPPCDPTALVAP
ncbi:MAG TPA: serine/threonine-protein kinase, partial [Candidatus Nanopelagicales bacterium]|nr:serine/threonine-protein kinase [Candidatus Nanopelagicales bacterium]